MTDYTVLTKEERTDKVKASIHSYEQQHFDQSRFADEAEAAASTERVDPLPEAEHAEAVANYRVIAARHRFNAKEAENRLAVCRALLAAIEGEPDPKPAARPPRRSTG